ncbi:MAG: HAD-IA family hydrolase [Prevotella sp.]|nr:HAD-IA family hydrolase [Prevotella sp.]MBR1881269.1 HAD-IA family hydrolase [Prevotella sp.]
MNIPRLVIFDFDGTLGDTRRNIVMTLQQTMQAAHLPVIDEARCAATIGLTLKDSFKTLFPHLTDEEAEACAATYRRIFEVNKKKMVPQLFPHVAETLAELCRQRVVVSIASSRNSTSLRGFLQDMAIEQYVSFVVGADDVARPKPDPEPVLKTLAAMNIPADETLVVGDMPVDILMGRNAGTRTCGVTYGNASRQQLEEAGADFVIDDMEELISMAQDWDGTIDE